MHLYHEKAGAWQPNRDWRISQPERERDLLTWDTDLPVKELRVHSRGQILAL